MTPDGVVSIQSARRGSLGWLRSWLLTSLLMIGVPPQASGDAPATPEALARQLLDALVRSDLTAVRDLAATRRAGREQEAWLRAWVESMRGEAPGRGASREFRITDPGASDAYDPTINTYRIAGGIRVLASAPDRFLTWAPNGREERLGLLLENGVWRWAWPLEEVRGAEIEQAFVARQALRRRDAPLRGLPPLPLHVETPLAPASMVDSGGGCARLRFTVRADGTVADIRFNARPSSAYGKAARDALAQWRFAPSDEDQQAFQSFAFEVNTDGRWTAGFGVQGSEPTLCRGLPWP